MSKDCDIVRIAPDGIHIITGEDETKLSAGLIVLVLPDGRQIPIGTVADVMMAIDTIAGAMMTMDDPIEEEEEEAE